MPVPCPFPSDNTGRNRFSRAIAGGRPLHHAEAGRQAPAAGEGQQHRRRRVLLDPASVEVWSTKAHKAVLPAVADVIDRTPLVVLAGDVGTGKTELAETVGDAIARQLGVPVMLYPLSLSARGHGAVGEMTTLLTKAFDTMHEHAKAGRGRDG